MSDLFKIKGLRLGDTAPDFKATTTEGSVSFHDWMDDCWCIIFSHPKDFTPVCTTELGAAAKTKPEFDKRNVKLLGISIDPLITHLKWIKDIEETQQVKMNFPIISDPKGEIASLYGMIHPQENNTSAVRSVFIIDPDKIIRLILLYPENVGRNFGEILRVIDALQLGDLYSVATPADWKPGEDCIIHPSVTDPEELRRKFPNGWNEIKPYLRIVPNPDN